MVFPHCPIPLCSVITLCFLAYNTQSLIGQFEGGRTAGAFSSDNLPDEELEQDSRVLPGRLDSQVGAAYQPQRQQQFVAGVGACRTLGDFVSGKRAGGAGPAASRVGGGALNSLPEEI